MSNTVTMDTVGVVVGRFQCNELHAGHLALLNHVAQRYERMLILVGVRLAEASDANPLSFEIRKVMLQDAYPKATILPIVDCREDEVWSKNVDATIRATYGYEVQAVFHVGRKSFASSYTGAFPIEYHDFGMVDFAAKDVRNNIKHAVISSPAERLGAIYAVMNLPHRHTIMVDMFMVKPDGNGSYSALLGRKEGERKWRLPGGRVDGTESFREAASREMAEETGLHTTDGVEGWFIVDDFNVRDWRVRDTDRITYKTILMVGKHSWGKPEAGDDLIEVRWVPAEELKYPDIIMVEEHVHLVAAAMTFVNKNASYLLAKEYSNAT